MASFMDSDSDDDEVNELTSWLDEKDEEPVVVVKKLPVPVKPAKIVPKSPYIVEHKDLFYALCEMEDFEFEKLSDSQQEALMRTLKVESFAAGENIIVEGDTGNDLFIVVATEETADNAEVEVVMQNQQLGTEVFLTRLRRGQYFGQKYFVTRRAMKRGATVRVPIDASVPVEVARLVSDFFDKWGEFRNLLLVKNVPLIQQLPRKERSSIIQNLVIREFRDGEYIIRQGENGEDFFIILEGSVKIVENKNGADVTLTTLREGHFFGEIALVTDEPRVASVISVKTTICFVLSKQVFRCALSDASFNQVLKDTVTKIQEIRNKKKATISEAGQSSKKAPSATPNNELRRVMSRTSRPFVTTTVATKKLASGSRVINKYVVDKELGRGSFGEVYLCTDQENGAKFAMKTINRPSATAWNDEAANTIRQEIAVMKRLSHPNIVALREVIDDQNSRKIYLIQEYMEGGALMPDAESCEPMDQVRARQYFRDIVRGVCYLHSEGIVHRDIKPQNMLLSGDGTVKIADFGAAVFTGNIQAKVSFGGTPAFMAPELYLTTSSGIDFTKHPGIDIFALGATLYYMVVGRPPWMAKNQIDLATRIKNFELTFPPNITDPHLKHLLKQMLTKDYRTRCTLDTIVVDDWVTMEGSEPLFNEKEFLDGCTDFHFVQKLAHSLSPRASPHGSSAKSNASNNSNRNSASGAGKGALKVLIVSESLVVRTMLHYQISQVMDCEDDTRPARPVVSVGASDMQKEALPLLRQVNQHYPPEDTFDYIFCDCLLPKKLQGLTFVKSARNSGFKGTIICMKSASTISYTSSNNNNNNSGLGGNNNNNQSTYSIASFASTTSNSSSVSNDDMDEFLAPDLANLVVVRPIGTRELRKLLHSSCVEGGKNGADALRGLAHAPLSFTQEEVEHAITTTSEAVETVSLSSSSSLSTAVGVRDGSGNVMVHTVSEDTLLKSVPSGYMSMTQSEQNVFSPSSSPSPSLAVPHSASPSANVLDVEGETEPPEADFDNSLPDFDRDALRRPSDVTEDLIPPPLSLSLAVPVPAGPISSPTSAARGMKNHRAQTRRGSSSSSHGDVHRVSVSDLSKLGVSNAPETKGLVRKRGFMVVPYDYADAHGTSNTSFSNNSGGAGGNNTDPAVLFDRPLKIFSFQEEASRRERREIAMRHSRLAQQMREMKKNNINGSAGNTLPHSHSYGHALHMHTQAQAHAHGDGHAHSLSAHALSAANAHNNINGSESDSNNTNNANGPTLKSSKSLLSMVQKQQNSSSLSKKSFLEKKASRGSLLSSLSMRSQHSSNSNIDVENISASLSSTTMSTSQHQQSTAQTHNSHHVNFADDPTTLAAHPHNGSLSNGQRNGSFCNGSLNSSSHGLLDLESVAEVEADSDVDSDSDSEDEGLRAHRRTHAFPGVHTHTNSRRCGSDEDDSDEDSDEDYSQDAIVQLDGDALDMEFAKFVPKKIESDAAQELAEWNHIIVGAELAHRLVSRSRSEEPSLRTQSQAHHSTREGRGLTVLTDGDADGPHSPTSLRTRTQSNALSHAHNDSDEDDDDEDYSYNPAMGVKFAHCDNKVSRSYMEDRTFCSLSVRCEELLPSPSLSPSSFSQHSPHTNNTAQAEKMSRPVGLFAVFDGHSGDYVAQHLQTHYAECFARVYSEKMSNTEDPTLQDLSYEAKMERVFEKTNQRLDREILEKDFARQQKSLRGGIQDLNYAGSVAVVAVVVPFVQSMQSVYNIKSGVEVFLSHIGDCRAVLSRDGQAIQLTEDHKPTLRSEKARIDNAGGWVQNGRVNGGLGVSRSFGDIQFKAFSQCAGFVGDETSPRGIWGVHQPVISKPDFYHFVVDDTSYEFMILASDGLWDVFPSQDAVNFVRKCLVTDPDLDKAAQALVQKAIQKGTQDNTSVVIVAFNQ